MAPKLQKSELNVWDTRIVGREGKVTFEMERMDWWEICTIPGPWKGRRMWVEPSKLSPTADGDVWILSDDKLTPAFEHPVVETELAGEGGGRSRRSRRSTGGPSARNSVEPSLAPPPNPAPSKPPPPKRTPPSEASTSRRASMRRSQSATVSVPVSPVKVKKEVVQTNAAAGPIRRRSQRTGPEPEVKTEEHEALLSPDLVDEPEALVEDGAADVLPPPPPPQVDAGSPSRPSPPPFEAPSKSLSPPSNPPSPPPVLNLPSPSFILEAPPREPFPPPSTIADAPSQPSPPPSAPLNQPLLPPASQAPLSAVATPEHASEPPASPPAVEDPPQTTPDDPVPASSVATPSNESLHPIEAVTALATASAREEPLPKIPAPPKEPSPAPIASPLPEIKIEPVLPEPSSSSVEEHPPSSMMDSAPQEEIKTETIVSLPAAPSVKEEVKPRPVEAPRSSNPFALGPSPSSSTSRLELVDPTPLVELETTLVEEKPNVEPERQREPAEDSKDPILDKHDVAPPSTTSDLLPVASNASPLPIPPTSTAPSFEKAEARPPLADPLPFKQDLLTPKAANPFGRTTPSSVPGPTTPLVLESASLLPSAAAPSPPRDHVGETAFASPLVKEEDSVGIVVGPSTSDSTKIEDMEVDSKPLAPSSLASADAPRSLPSFKRKSGSSASSSQPKKSKPSPNPTSTEERPSETKDARDPPRVEPKMEVKTEEKVEMEGKTRPESKEKGKEKEKEPRAVEPIRTGAVKERATHPQPPSLASQPSPRPSVPSRKGKERALPDSDDSDDFVEIKTSPKPKVQPPSKRKEPEPDSSPLTQEEEEEDEEDETKSPVKSSRTVTSELIKPPPVKKAKKSSQSNRIESSEEEESSRSSSSSSEEEAPKKPNLNKKSFPNLKNSSKSLVSKSSASTPTVASPASNSSAKPVASSSSTPKISKASSTSTITTSSKASGSSSQLLPKKTLLKSNDGTSTPKDRTKIGGSSGTSTPSSSKPKPKAVAAKGSGWLTSLLPGDVSSPQASSSNLKLSTEAKKNKALEEEIARKRKAFLAQVDAETAKPLDIEAQSIAMQHHEKWQQTGLHKDDWLYPHCNGGGFAAAEAFHAKDARGEIPNERMPRPRNALEAAEGLDFAWIQSMEGNWEDAEKVQAYLHDPKYFPRGPGVNW
ncbi:hypothetical protein BDY24DRAFT_386674 [Mrakia frigida]|uniref:uncharacterized protein n=1 Tax=Mrakia frigida TaxID=29902 RepID=UPI003FCC071B